MSWSVGYDPKWKRDIGYGVPALCDHPSCTEAIHRGLDYVCGGQPFGGDTGCGLYFCSGHLSYALYEGDWSEQLCDRCLEDEDPFEPSPDTVAWVAHKLSDDSWKQWRDENPGATAELEEAM